MRILRPISQALVRAMLDAGHDSADKAAAFPTTLFGNLVNLVIAVYERQAGTAFFTERRFGLARLSAVKEKTLLGHACSMDTETS